MKKYEPGEILQLTTVPPGWRAVIGLILPSVDRGTTELDYRIIFPEGVIPLVTRALFKDPSPEEYMRMEEDVEHAAELLATANPSCTSYTCTAGSFIKGIEYDREIIAKIAKITGRPATTMACAVGEALKMLQAETIVLVAPYPDEVVAAELKYYTEQGFNIAYHHGLNISSGSEIARVTPWEVYDLAMRAFEKAPSGVDAIFISCGGLRAIGIIDWIEKATGVPCVHSNQCNAWHCLKLSGIHEPIYGIGKLLEMER